MKKKMMETRQISLTLSPMNPALYPLKMYAGFLLLAMLMVFSSCEKETLGPDNEPESIIPDRFMVEIPGSISSSESIKSMQADTMNGNHIYQHLRTFIAAAESGAELAQNIMLSIAVHNLNRPLELTYISDEDGRTKHLEIVENAVYEDQNWQYRLTISDAEGSTDNGQSNIGLQVFWSWNPLSGIALINPYNCDRTTEESYAETSFRIDYSETGNLGYEAHMFVSISGFPLPSPLQEPFGMDNMKMFVGKNGDQVTLYGNSQHPNTQFYNNETGFNWAFVAAALENQDMAVAEVGLPPVGLDETDREVLLETYSVYNVLRNQVLSVWPGIDNELLDTYLYNTQAPGYFNASGFVQAGTAPSDDYLPLTEHIQNLAPFNPAEILNLSITFDE